MHMRLIFVALLTVASLGCRDDDDESTDGGSRDAGSDAATDDRRDADGPAIDARVADGSCLEGSYIWASVEECFREPPPQPIALRVTLAELCADYECPADWNAALVAAAECGEDADAGWDACWRATTECGANLLKATRGPDGRFLYYDHATGELIGAAIQLSDAAQDCVVSEIIAGERPPICCEEPDAG